MTRTDYDIVTVGGGLAGAAFARTMAQNGASVLVLEREQEFRDRVRGEYLAPWGVEELERLGLLDALERAGGHPMPSVQSRAGKPRKSATPGGQVARNFYHPRLQEALLEEAARAGAHVLRGQRVTAVTGGVTPTVQAGEGEIRARLVVGADGRKSLARRATGQDDRVHRTDRVLAGVRIGNVSGPDDTGYFLIQDDATALGSIFPQGDGHARAYVFVYEGDASTFAGPEGFGRFMQALMDTGVPAEVVGEATQEGPLAGFVASDSWVPRAYCQGVALIGDAAGISDPTWGQGISLAFHDVRVLAKALQSDPSWHRAGMEYAHERAGYYHRILTVENWQTDLLLTPGADADDRRKRAVRRWASEPDRVPDLLGNPLDMDTSERSRRRFFGEDDAAA